LIADQPQVRLVDEGRGLERLAGGFGRHPRGGELAQLVVHERQQVGLGPAVAGRGRIEAAGHIGHDGRVYQLLAAEPQETEGDLVIGHSRHGAATNSSTMSHSWPREV
jgi:hypothetical protein